MPARLWVVRWHEDASRKDRVVSDHHLRRVARGRDIAQFGRTGADVVGRISGVQQGLMGSSSLMVAAVSTRFWLRLAAALSTTAANLSKIASTFLLLLPAAATIDVQKEVWRRLRRNLVEHLACSTGRPLLERSGVREGHRRVSSSLKISELT